MELLIPILWVYAMVAVYQSVASVPFFVQIWDEWLQRIRDEKEQQACEERLKVWEANLTATQRTYLDFLERAKYVQHVPAHMRIPCPPEWESGIPWPN